MRKRYDFETNEGPYEDSDIFDGPNKRSKTSVYSFPWFVNYIFVFYLLGLYLLMDYIGDILPKPLKVADEQFYPDAFITERAEHDLKLLTQYGPRVVGSYENEVLTVNFLQTQINMILHQANKNQIIESDLQVVTGSYYLDYRPDGQINTYSNVQNIIVKIHAANPTNKSILVNAHFDSVPTSPGGSDDGINIVAMLEILRKLSRSSERPLHNIILLFNGAEETILQAAHGFITQHKWAEGCEVVVNLEAAGAGGKIVLFQTGPSAPWLIKYYAMVPHPHAQVAGEEIFQSGIIPSDTDFRVFRDFGGLVGLDMAFYINGYRYHTKYDNFSNIPLGSYQHVGDNALSLVRNLANAPELLSNETQSGKMVYFDVLGLFLVRYDTTIAIIINLLAVVVSAILFITNLMQCKIGLNRQSLVYIIITLGAILLGWIFAITFTICLGYFLDLIGSSMSWYAHPAIIFGLYSAPAIALQCIPLFWVNHENLSLNMRCLIQVHLVRLIWTGILLVGTIFNLRSMYALVYPIFFNSLAFGVNGVFKWHHTIRKWKIIYVALLIIPTVLLMTQTNITLKLFIPITGRVGSDKRVEVMIGALSVVFTILITSPYVALVTLVRNFKYFFLSLFAVFLITFIAVLTFAFPYSGDVDSPAPQRQWILHTSRTFHDANGTVEKADAGIFFINMDRNSPNSLRKYVKDLDKAKPVDCSKYLLCGLPLPHVKIIQIIHESTWLPANQPLLPQPLKFTYTKEAVSSKVVRFNVSAAGPDRLFIYISPKEQMTLLNISLLEEVPVNNHIFQGRPLYFILHTFGREADSFSFQFDIVTPENWRGPVMDIAITAAYVHDKKNVKTPYYMKILNEIPDWADVTAMLGSYSSWVL